MFSCECIKDLPSALALLNRFLKNKDLYDSVLYRSHILSHFHHELYFFVCTENGQEVGLLPLFYDESIWLLVPIYPGGLHFDSLFPTEKSQEVFFYLIEQVKKTNISFQIYSILFTSLPMPQGFINSWEKSYYYIDLLQYESADDYLRKNFSSKTFLKLKRQFRKVEEHELTFEMNNPEHVKVCIDLNLQKHGTESVFYGDDDFAQGFIALPNIFDVQVITIKYQNTIESVWFGIVLDNVFYCIHTGTKYESINNLWKYLIYKLIELAFSLWCEKFDAGARNSNRKEEWKLQKRITGYFDPK